MALSERNPGLERAERRLLKSAAFRRNRREYKASCYKKGQHGRVGLVVLVVGERSATNQRFQEGLQRLIGSGNRLRSKRETAHPQP